MMDAGLAIEVAAKGALVLAAACVLYALMRQYAASQRHLVLAVAMLGVLMIPAFAVVLPNVTLPIRATGIDTEIATTAGASTIVAPRTPRVVEPRDTMVGGSLAAPSASISVAPPTSSFSVLSVITIVWLTGFAAALMPLVIGLIGIRRVRRSGRTLVDPEWTGALRAARVGLGITTPITLIESPRARVPMTWGVFRAVVALPESARDWSPQRRQVVLCHELAHIKRRDFFTQLIARVACAAHWFNPLSWWTLRAMSLERERACDDLVVASGVRAPDYAEHLLQIVRDMQGASFTARTAIAMAGVSRLEQRVRALLDATQNRRTLSAGGRIATIGAALGCIALVAALQPTAVAEEANSDEDTKIVIKIDDDEKKNVRIKQRHGSVVGLYGRQEDIQNESPGDFDLGEILGHVSEVLEDIDLDVIIEKAVRSLEREDVQRHINRALEHIEDVDVQAEIEHAIGEIDSIELTPEDVQEIRNLDKHEIRRELRKVKRHLRDADMDAQLEDVRHHLEGIDLDVHIDSALDQLSQMQDSPEWDEAMEAVHDVIGEIDLKSISAIVGETLEGIELNIEPILEATARKVEEIDIDALVDTLHDKIEDIDIVVAPDPLSEISGSGSSQSDLESLLEQDDLRKANLRQAKLSGMDLRGKDLRGARLAGADLREANLEGADLRDADLSGANLREANLRNAELDGALLDGTNLRDADLTGVLLHKVELSGADMRGAQISKSHRSN